MRALLAIVLLTGCQEVSDGVAGLVVPSAEAVTEAEVRVVSDTTDAVALTIYPDNLALVTETRTVTLPAGRSTVQFDGVTDLIIPQTLVLRELSGGTLERNFDYDLLGRASLFTESVGETVRLTRIAPESGEVFVDEAEIVSANADNGVVVRTEDGLEGLFCSGLGTRAGFEGLPPGLAARPAMNVDIEVEEAGEQTLVISYLTTGMGWAADYRLDLIGSGVDEANLLGWLSVENSTSKRFKEINISVIAGRLNRRRDTREVEPPRSYLRAACWPVGSTKDGIDKFLPGPGPNVVISESGNAIAFMPQPAMMMAAERSAADSIVVTGSRVKAVQEEVGDYKLYRIPRILTVGAMQTKQLAFLDEAGVEVTERFVLDLRDLRDMTMDRPEALSLRYDIDNSRDGGLAVALPKGSVRVFGDTVSGRPVYLGADEIEDLPVDQDAKVVTGRSTTVFARVETVNVDANSNEEVIVAHRVTLTNAGNRAVEIELTDVSPNTRVQGAERVEDEDVPTWRLALDAESSVELEVRQ